MTFLYPLFLTALAALAVPVLIHLFNLRKYKTVFFPSTRFLRDIKLTSRKQSELRYKLLLASRMLFLAALVLAFAQPFLSKSGTGLSNDRLQVVYLDNSPSMTVKKGNRTLFDISREAAAAQVKRARHGSRFLVLTNDRPQSFYPVPAEKALQEIYSADASSNSKTIVQVLSSVQSLRPAGSAGQEADVYCYSDFQQNVIPNIPDSTLTKGISFYGMTVRADIAGDMHIDTAYLTRPFLEAGKNNNLIVVSKSSGKVGDNPVLQLMVNGRVKCAASPNFGKGGISVDTLKFMADAAGAQRMELTLNDAAVKFDDTFRIAARSAPNLSVLVVDGGKPNPYIQAAFRAYNGFRLNEVDAGGAPADWKNYNLVILNGITEMPDPLLKTVAKALSDGQNICLFPGKTTHFDHLNAALHGMGDLSIAGLDTAVQTVAALREGSGLAKDLFERIPDNVQLPVATWHYVLHSGLSANAQSVMVFRNGDPFLVRYTPLKGQLYVCASSADLESGNFPGSYFFAPFLYRMAAESGGSSVYAVSAGTHTPVYFPLSGSSERDAVHVFGNGVDVVPPQRPRGGGIDVFVDDAVGKPGFYDLAFKNSDTVSVAVNMDKSECDLAYPDLANIKDVWKGDVHWMSTDDTQAGADVHAPFPLWKIAALLAVAAAFFETLLLVKPKWVGAA